MKTRLTLSTVVEARLEELQLLDLSGHFLDHSPASIYGRALIAHYTADLAALRKLLESQIDCKEIVELIRMRVDGHEKRIDADQVALWPSRVSGAIFQAEAFFLGGMAFEKLDLFDRSREFHLNAARLYEAEGLKRKAVKASFNALVARSRIETRKTFFLEYRALAQQAKRVKEHSISGLCFLNSSRELEKLGALQNALRFADQALKLLSGDMGTRHQLHAQLHRVHLLARLQRESEARREIELVLKSSHPEIQSAARMLIEKFPFLAESMVESLGSQAPLHPAYHERLAESDESIGSLEERLVLLLSQEPRTKMDLIEKLYGTRISFEHAENRLKNLLNRLRKRRRGVIFLSQGRYHLASDYDPKLSERLEARTRRRSDRIH